jgi:hypothetical protein
MGFMDKLKGTANKAKDLAADAKGKAVEAVDEHGDQIKGGIGKAGEFVNKQTKGKYADKISQGTAKAEQLVDKADASDDAPAGSAEPAHPVHPDAGVTPPPPPPPGHEHPTA